MPGSKPLRGKKYHPTPVYGNRKTPVKANWMRVTKTTAIILLCLLMLTAIAGILIKHIGHIFK